MKPAPAAADTVAPILRRPKKRTIAGGLSASSPTPAADVPKEVLIIGSRLKGYIRQRFGYNVSDRVLGPLSDIVRQACDEAAVNALRDERRTVLDRDIPKPRS